MWNNYDTFTHIQRTKNWFGVRINNSVYKYEPQTINNKCQDVLTNKVAIIIHNQIHHLLKVYSDVKKDDIQSDEITGLGLISVYDCKQIVK